MYYSPAQYVISLFGGVRATARALNRSAASVGKWTKPKSEKGTDGKIPLGVQDRLLELAKKENLDLRPEDLIVGRELPEKKLPQLR